MLPLFACTADLHKSIIIKSLDNRSEEELMRKGVIYNAIILILMPLTEGVRYATHRIYICVLQGGLFSF